MEGLQGLIDVAFYAVVGVALAVSGFFFVMGVFNFMSAGGDQQKTQQGITGMRNSLIGAVLIGGAGLIINFVVLDIIRPGGGEAGTLGQGLSCDQLLRQTLQTNPVSLANGANVHLVIKEIQARDECPVTAWNPQVVSGTPPTIADVAGVALPPTLCAGNVCSGAGAGAVKANPVRDARGNIYIRWADAGVGTPASTTTQDRSANWLYTASSGSWWSE